MVSLTLLVSYLWIIGRVVLYNPVDTRNIKTAGSHVCTQQDSLLRVAELEERLRSLCLLLLALFMKTHHLIT